MTPNTVLYILIGLGLLLLVFYSFKKIADNIDFELDFNSFDFKKLMLSKGGQSSVNIKLTLINKNIFSLKIKDFYLEVYKDNQLILCNKDKKPFENTLDLISGKRSTSKLSFDVFLNKGFFTVASDLVSSKKKSKIDYKLSFKVFGITIKTGGEEFIDLND